MGRSNSEPFTSFFFFLIQEILMSKDKLRCQNFKQPWRETKFHFYAQFLIDLFLLNNTIIQSLVLSFFLLPSPTQVEIHTSTRNPTNLHNVIIVAIIIDHWRVQKNYICKWYRMPPLIYINFQNLTLTRTMKQKDK